MSNMTDYLEKKVGDHTLGITSFTKPTADYISSHTASPTDTGSLSAEVSTSATGYARVSITSLMNATNSTSGLADNASVITLGPATADWGTQTHLGISDASTTGNMLFWGALNSSRTINTGDSLQYAANQLAITFA